MLTRSKTIPIVFNGGAYGTYLEWLLTTLTTDCAIIEPFNTDTGSSHNFRGNHLGNIDNWNTYLNSGKNPTQFVRIHPKLKKTDSISKGLETILSTVERVLYLYPGPDSVVLSINNFYSKVWKDWWLNNFDSVIDPNKIYANWPVDPKIPLNQIPIWIRREFLSYYLLPAWFDQVEWFHPDKWSHNRCKTILVKELLYNIKYVLEDIRIFTNLKFNKPIELLLPAHEKMLQLQKHQNQDLLCSNIIDSVVNKNNFDWSDQELPLASQSYIQWKLREIGYEIECHGLDLFPTNNVHLRSILYSKN
jgi:hypothetical protein